MTAKAFENVKNQIGFCGIWCGSCLGGNGAIPELAKRFEKIANRPGLEQWVPKDFDFKEFLKGLSSIQAMTLCPGCQKGGGIPNCKVRLCAKERGVTICAECNLLSKCQNFEQLEKDSPKIKQDLMEIKGKNREELVEKWMGELEKKWPHCILVCESAKK